MKQEFGLLDKFIVEVDTAIRTLLVPANRESQREYPASTTIDDYMSDIDKKHAAGLMRVNHAGEVCAQALYQGQALTAKLSAVRQQMAEAAFEEVEHLAWCEQRLRELGSSPSKFNLFWYIGSLVIGATAGLISDNISLGFVAETERQVSAHLQAHLAQLPAADKRSRKILTQMKIDEEEHAQAAIAAGAVEFISPVRWLMSKVSKIMTNVVYHV